MLAGALLVCRVDSTLWPVSEARKAMSAVSRSRISPTRTMSGSWRRAARRPWAKSRPIFSFVCTWVMPSMRYSMGFSMVKMLISVLLKYFSMPNKVVVLPAPVGPVTRISP